MAMTDNEHPQKKRGRPATGKDPQVGFRAPADLVAGIDAYASSAGLSRSATVRLAVDRLLGEASRSTLRASRQSSRA